jgi:two-component system KDP operon response regulator KdpE
MDKLRGFHLGVDDYVSKPFSFAEVVARIRAVLARVRGNVSKTQHLTSGNLTIEFDQRKVTVDGNVVELSPTEFRLLETLARQVHRTLPTEQLVIQVWGEAYAGEVEHVKRYIWALRKKIERDPGDPRHILTERGYGYRFE